MKGRIMVLSRHVLSCLQMRTHVILCIVAVLILLLVVSAVGCQEIYCGRALEYIANGSKLVGDEEYEQAIEEFDKAIEVCPDSISAHRERGEAYYRMEEYGQAIADYTKAISLFPESGRKHDSYADVHFKRGNAYYRTGEYNEAIADYTKTIEIDPNLAEPNFNRGLVYSVQGREAEARADFETFINLSDDPDKIAEAEQRTGELIEKLS